MQSSTLYCLIIITVFNDEKLKIQCKIGGCAFTNPTLLGTATSELSHMLESCYCYKTNINLQETFIVMWTTLNVRFTFKGIAMKCATSTVPITVYCSINTSTGNVD